MFSNNTASSYGGAISINDNGNITFGGNSISQFSSNTAIDGGALHSYYNSFTSFKGNSTTVFSNNIAFHYGAVVYAESDCDITFGDNFRMCLTNNKASDGAIVYSKRNSKIMARGNSSITFNDTPAKWCNNVCLPYTNSMFDDVVTIDSNGIVRCSYQERFTCQMKKCYCNEFQRHIHNDSSIIVTDTVNTIFSCFI